MLYRLTPCCHCLQIQQLEHLQQLTLCRTTGHSRPCSTIDPMTYRQRLKAVLSPPERTVFAALNSPKKIQDYLDTLPINFETAGETYMSPRRVIRNQTAHCFEGALLAAAAFSYHGQKPLLLDLVTIDRDEDHVVALFRENGLWGAISKTNHPILRYRDPVYKSIPE